MPYIKDFDKNYTYGLTAGAYPVGSGITPNWRRKRRKTGESAGVADYLPPIAGQRRLLVYLFYG